MLARSLILAAVACLVLAGCPAGGGPNSQSRPHGHADTSIAISPSGDAILFNAVGTGDRDLYLLNLKDHRVARVADTPHYETAPSFAPDGRTIVYSAGVPGDRADHVFAMTSGGREKTQLTHDDANDTSPRFSPDGMMIVFARDRAHQWGGLAANWDLGGVICVMDCDGGNLRQLTPDDTFAADPRFTSDGVSVIYSTPEGRRIVPVDGSTPPRSIPGPVGAVSSPDEKSISYCRGVYAADFKLYTADRNGEGERRLAPDLTACFHPVYSPTGDALYFIHVELPDAVAGVRKHSVWRTAVDGSCVEMVADRGLFDDPRNWTPAAAPAAGP